MEDDRWRSYVGRDSSGYLVDTRRKPAILRDMATNTDTKILRAVKRERAIREGNLAGYRMAGRTMAAKKGKGSYTRKEKHRGVAA